MLTSTSGPSLQSSVQTDSTLNGAGFINPAVNVLSAPGAHAKGGGLKTTTKDQAIQHLGLANKQNTKDRKNTGRRAPHETPAPSPGKAHQAKTLKTNLQGNMIWCLIRTILAVLLLVTAAALRLRCRGLQATADWPGCGLRLPVVRSAMNTGDALV